MTREQLYSKYKLEDFFYHHIKEDYEYDGFIFKTGEYYESYHDSEIGVSFRDDNGMWHNTDYMDRGKIY